ncbi:four helix bundle protein [bacterium]|nr:four helix bundle protein [bacterium]
MLIESHTQLDVYKKAFDAAMDWFEVSKGFPREEVYSLTDQGRRASRSVCANLAEAWRTRRYEAAFVAKITDAEGEAAEVQTWTAFAVRCAYLNPTKGAALHATYEEVIRMLVAMRCRPEKWVITTPKT